MSVGLSNIVFQSQNIAGDPFPAGAANNGLSVDPVTGRIVLGNDAGGMFGQLLSDRELPLNAFSLSFTQGSPVNGQIGISQSGANDTIFYSVFTGLNPAGGFGSYLFNEQGFSLEASDGITAGAVVFDASTEGDIRHDVLLRLRGLTPGSNVQVECANGLTIIGSGVMLRTGTSWTDGAGVAVGTLTNAPAAGDPTKWIPVDDNGTTRFIPAW